MDAATARTLWHPSGQVVTAEILTQDDAGFPGTLGSRDLGGLAASRTGSVTHSTPTPAPTPLTEAAPVPSAVSVQWPLMEMSFL